MDVNPVIAPADDASASEPTKMRLVKMSSSTQESTNVDLDILNYKNRDFVHIMNLKSFDLYDEDEFRDLLKLSVVQEIKLNFYKLGAILVDVLKESHPNKFKYIFIFNFP